MRTGVNTPLLSAFALLIFLAILKPISTDLAFAFAFLYQIYIPSWLGYESHIFQNSLRSDLLRTLWVSILTLSLFALGYHFVQNYWANAQGYETHFRPAFAWSFLWSLAVNLILISLPEEIFYRGFLQSRLKGLSGILIVNLLFALGHFVGEYDPVRLLPFFPGLVFSWLVWRSSGSLVGATIYHALCNVFSEWLAACYTWSNS